jgi:hypothetical protein
MYMNFSVSKLAHYACLFIIFLSSPLVLAEQETKPGEVSVAEQLQQLKRQVISLNRDLFVLEEDLLYPSSTQVAVYLAMDVGEYFKLDAVEIKIDDKNTTSYLYTPKQIDALFRGGVQRLYVGNVAQGEHRISAFFTGIGPENRPYKRATTALFHKDADAKALELVIKDSSAKQQPEFSVTEL